MPIANTTLSQIGSPKRKAFPEEPDDLLRLCKRVGKKSNIYLIDIPAQKTDYIVETLEKYNVIDLAAEDGVRFTILLFMSDDPAAKDSLQKVVSLIGPRADYVAIRVPSRFKSRHYLGSSLQKSLPSWGAKEIEVPPITQSTLDELQRARIKSGRWLTLAESTQSEYVNRYSQHEIGYFLNRMYVQWQGILPHLIPDRVTPKNTVQTIEMPKTDYQANLDVEIPE